ncbi:MAG: M20/M25/M40 family metallo-hydrolase [Candidatus Moraniibacteriota bacterium]
MDYHKEFLNIVKGFGDRVRLSGSRGELDAVKYIKNYIVRNIGGKSIIQKFKILTWREKSTPSLIVAGETVSCRSAYYSPKSNIKGKLEYFTENTEEKENEFDVYCIKNSSGTILSLLYVSQKYPNPFYYNRGSATYLMPSVIVGSDYRDFFTKNIGKEVKLRIDAKYLVKNSYNLVHKLSNRKNKFKLIIGAHMDTVPQSKGIFDNASGVAGAMIISKILKNIKLPFDIWIVYFGAEENAMFGSKFFVETLSEAEIKMARYMISIDGIGMGDKTCLYSEKDYFTQLKRSFGEIGENAIIDDVDNMLDASDHYYFKLMGVDSCFVEGQPGTFYYHSKEANDLANLNVELSVKTVQSLIEFIKNIEFQSPRVVFENRKTRVLQRILNFLK